MSGQSRSPRPSDNDPGEDAQPASGMHVPPIVRSAPSGLGVEPGSAEKRRYDGVLARPCRSRVASDVEQFDCAIGSGGVTRFKHTTALSCRSSSTTERFPGCGLPTYPGWPIQVRPLQRAVSLRPLPQCWRRWRGSAVACDGFGFPESPLPRDSRNGCVGGVGNAPLRRGSSSWACYGVRGPAPNARSTARVTKPSGSS